MDIDRYKERILETENLTDELEDDEANWLLDWGVARLDDVLGDIDDEEAAGNQVNALMAVIRKVNRITGSYSDKDPESLAQELIALAELHRQAFGQHAAAFLILQPEIDAARLGGLTPRQVVEFLTQGTQN